MRLVYPLLWSRPGRQACQEQTVCTAAALARGGVDVTLLMPRAAGDPALDADALRAWVDVEGDFRLVQRASRWSGPGLAASLMWLRAVFRDPLLASADLLYSRIPAMLVAGQRSPVPFATDHYRPWPDRLPAIRPLLRRTAKHPGCLGLIVHSEYAAAAYRRIGIGPECLLVAHNGVEAPRSHPSPAKAEARRRLGLPADRAIAVYAGRINARKGLDQVLAAAALRPEILFLLVGSEGAGPVERRAASRDNVRILPWCARAELPLRLAAADILLVPAARAPLERYGDCVLPMKLFAYLAAGRPILAPRSPDTAELLRDGETALLVTPDRPAEAAAALDRLLGDAALAARLAARARELAGNLTWDHRAERIAGFLDSRLSAQRSLYSSTVTAISRPTIGADQAPSAAGQ